MSMTGQGPVSRSGKQWPAFPGIPIFLETHDERAAPKSYGTTPTTPTTPETLTHGRPTQSNAVPLTVSEHSPAPTSPTTTIQTSSNRSSLWPAPIPAPEIHHDMPRRPALHFFPSQYPRVRLGSLPTLQIPQATEKTPINTHPGLGIVDGPTKPPTIHVSSPLDEKNSQKTQTPTNVAQRIEEKLWNYTRSGNVLKRWLLEIISWLFSAACMIAIIAVLANLQNQRLTKWWLAEKTGLTLNAYISILSKVAGAALILPVSEALGQLKWSWFLNHSKQMWDYEIFDNASRGPWGALLLLIRTKCRALAALGAVITLASLALDPFFQLVVDFPDRWALNNDTPSAIPRVIEYNPFFTPEYSGGYEINFVDPNFRPVVGQYVIDNGTQPIPFGNGTRPDIPLSCPTSNCTWPVYETLGVCSECRDASSLLEYACLHTQIDWSANQTGPNEPSSYPNGTVCGYFLNVTSSDPVLMSGYVVDNSSGTRPMGEMLLARSIPLTELLTKTPLYGGSINFKHVRNPIIDTIIVSSADPSANNPWAKAPIAHECVLAWCVKTVESSYIIGEYSENVTSTFWNTTDGPLPWKSSQFEVDGETYTETTYTQDIALTPPPSSRNQSSNLVFNNTYQMSNRTASNAILVFDDYFPSSYSTLAPGEDPMLRYKNFAAGPSFRKVFFNPMLAPNNITHHFERLATALTNAVRSDVKSKNMLQGDAYNMENYVAVRWEWLTLPLGLLFSALIFLAATIATSAGGKDGVGIWKTSAIATLLYGLPDDVQRKITSAEDGTPRAKAKELRVELKSDRRWRISGNIFSPFTPKPRLNQPPPGWI